MTRLPTGIRAANRDYMPHPIVTIVAAFLVDPAARFAWPSARYYLVAMPFAIDPVAGACFDQGTAYIAADYGGTALWLSPGVQPDGDALDKIFRESAKREHLDDLLATFEKMGESHPKEAHWYLAMIGVDPKTQGKGVGG